MWQIQSGKRVGTAGIILACALSQVGRARASTVMTPIALQSSSFNQNVVAGSGNDMISSLTAGMDGGVYAVNGSSAGATTFYTEGFNTGAPTTGVPLGQTITSQYDSNTTFTLQSATAAYNVAAVTGQSGEQSVTMALTTAGTYSELALLGVDNNGAMNYTIDYQNGNTQTGTISFPNWFSTGPVAYGADGRIYINAPAGLPTNGTPTAGFTPTGFGSFDQVGNSGGDLLFQEDITVEYPDDPITSITFTLPSGSTAETDAIFALSGAPVAVPEPASLGVLGLGALLLLRRRRALS